MGPQSLLSIADGTRHSNPTRHKMREQEKKKRQIFIQIRITWIPSLSLAWSACLLHQSAPPCNVIYQHLYSSYMQ